MSTTEKSYTHRPIETCFINDVCIRRNIMGNENENVYIFTSPTGKKTALVDIENFTLFHNYAFSEMQEILSVTADCESTYFSPPIDTRSSVIAPKPLSDFCVYTFDLVLEIVRYCNFCVYTYISPTGNKRGEQYRSLTEAFKSIGVDIKDAHEKYEFYVFTDEFSTFIKPKNGISAENPHWIKVNRPSIFF
jgi:hypothetical protein